MYVMTGRWSVWLFLVSLLLSGCQGKLYHYTDPTYGVSVSYPGNLSLISEKETLDQVVKPAESGAIDQPELLFVVATPGQSRLSCSVHHLPEGSAMSAEEYYQASTAKEIEQLEGTVIEEKSDVTINGHPFLRVGFTVKVDEMTELHIRIYQHLDSKSGRILVVTSMVEVSVWESESLLIEPVINSLKFHWS